MRVEHGTENRQNPNEEKRPNPKKPIDPAELTAEQLAQIKAFLDEQARVGETSAGDLTEKEAAAAIETRNTPDTPSDEVDTQSPAPKLSRRALLWGGGALALGLVGGGIVLANQPKSTTPKPIPSAPTPTPTPTETQQPTPSETASTPEGTSQMEMAQELLRSKNAEFNRMPLSLRQRAVDGRYNDIVSAFTDATLSYPYIAGMPPYTEGVRKFAGPESKDLIDFNPVDIASLVSGGEAPDNTQASAQDILNQLTFARAAAWGQIETPATRQLDQNTAANMVSGYFYDPTSRGAQDMIAELQRSKTIKIFGPESYTKPAHVTNSSVLRTHTFDGLGNLPYKVINYNLGNGKLYKIVTPVTTEFTGPDPRGVRGDIVTLSITKWLVLQEGTGTEDINGTLKHIS